MGIKDDTSSGALANCADGGHNIDRAKVLQATDPTVFTPKNPGNFASIRSAPVLEAPRYFSQEQAQALADKAKEAKEGVTHTKKAIKALAKIDTCDRKVNNLYYRKYAPVIASNELSKKRAMVSYAKHQHGLRPGYAKLGVGLEQAEQRAEMAIANIAASLG
jgi:histidinol-phosphate/aromatic aminotransferase/cobyric acid decarboxylase-like protein